MKKDKTAIILEVYNKPPKFINLALESQYIAVVYVNVTYAVANNKECKEFKRFFCEEICGAARQDMSYWSIKNGEFVSFEERL